MCGRAAQTQYGVSAAAMMLGVSTSSSKHDRPSFDSNQGQLDISNSTCRSDNYNMSPGMAAQIFFCDESDKISTSKKIWGLVPRGGTKKAPLSKGISQHFSNLMFNARSDTLFGKRTFRDLALKGRTCIIAVDGFFEWKATLSKEKKQPYYVFRHPHDDKNGCLPKSLLLAGLWTTVPTGRIDDPTLETFTIITTDVCPSLKWLHHRQPLFVWDQALAKQWLQHSPSPKVLQQLEDSSQRTPSNYLQWHAVTTKMSKTSYRSEDAITAIPLPTTVKSFFTKISDSVPSKATSKVLPPDKKHSLTAANSSPVAKRMKHNSPTKKGTITTFFSRKSS